MKLLFTTIYWILVAGITGVGLLLIASLVPVSGVKVKVVKSGSMEPAIHTGGIVVDMPASEYHVGDVVTFGADTKTQIPTTHRIVAIEQVDNNLIFTTKGDANDAPDNGKIRLADIHGKVIFTVPYVGYVLDFAKQPLGFFSLIGVPVLLIIFDELLKISREIQRIRLGRKNGGNDRGGPGTPNAPVTRIVPPPVSSTRVSTGVRPRAMDGIHMRVEMRSFVLAPAKTGAPHRNPYLTSIATILITCAVTMYVLPVGKTVSYLSNSEHALGNIFTATSVDLQLGLSADPTAKDTYLVDPDRIVGDVNSATDQKVAYSFATYPSADSAPFFYVGKGVFDADAAPECSALQLHAAFNGYAYDGPLNAFTSPATSSVGFWSFEISLPHGDTSLAPDQECGGSLVFTAQPIENGGILGGVFSDTERVPFEIYNRTPAPVVQAFGTTALDTPVESTETAQTDTPSDNTPPLATELTSE